MPMGIYSKANKSILDTLPIEQNNIDTEIRKEKQQNDQPTMGEGVFAFLFGWKRERHREQINRRA